MLLERYLDNNVIFYNSISKKRINITYLIFFGACVLIMGLRSITVGVDTAHYSAIFYTISETPWNIILTNWKTEACEIGYCILMKASASIFSSYYFFQFLIAALFNYLMLMFFRNNTKCYGLTAIIYLGLGTYTMAFNITRQMFSIAILTLAYDCFKKGNKKRSLLLYLIAITIHTVAVSFVLVYLFYLIKNNQKLILIVLCSIVLLTINFQIILRVVIKYVPMYAKFCKVSEQENSYGMIKYVWLVIAIISILNIYKYIKPSKHREDVPISVIKEYLNEDEVKTSRVITSLSCLVYVMCYCIGINVEFFERLGIIFVPFVIILFGQFQEQFIKKLLWKKTYSAIIFIAFF
ncbi:EpsG family protein [Ruminococcus sp. HUN007]|uniref:EpsG family protein n=1 Tax=Ruminococcus sp. HUN007 TaxID=1514668 RepID=UPI00241815CF|nr:EpsG family protein [Ruminococcus sp. HUN007]